MARPPTFRTSSVDLGLRRIRRSAVVPYFLRARLRGRVLASVVGALAVVLGAVPAADAACASGETTRAFAAFGDGADYSLVAGGSFESGASGWSLRSAWVAVGNEPFRVGGAGDSKSLAVMRYGEAVSPVFCVGVEHPSFRFFARRVSGYGGALHVSVRWSDDGVSKEKT